MKIFFSICICLITSACVAQKQAWHWYFGNNAGLDFSSGSAVVTTGSLSTYEGCASISDSAGNLQFYTDGLNVYDSAHMLMPNGTGLFGDPSSSQSSIIVKLPGSQTIFYIFTVDYNFGIHGFCYSIVDMTLNGGMGDVTLKNVLVRTPIYEKITAVKHGNNTDYWILINDWNNDDVYSYEFTSAGLNTNPVISGIGPFHNLWIGATGGYIKANRQGNKIALAMWDKNSFDICDFDNITGLASNHLVVQSADMVYAYGAEFSPDGRYLYGTNMDPPSHLYQFDLSSGTAAGILASRVTLGTSSIIYHYSALQIAPDGKIYCAHRNDYFIGAIQDPDSAGFLCNYIDSNINLSPSLDRLGLPNYPADYFFPTQTGPVAVLHSSDLDVCQEECISFSDSSLNNPTSWQWLFPGANPSSSIYQNPQQVCYSTPGSYDVTLIVSNGNGTDTLFLPGYITVYATPPPPVITQSNDTMFCGTPSNYSTFQWYYFGVVISGATDSFYVATQNGTYQLEVYDSNGCRTMVSTTIITGIAESLNKSDLVVIPTADKNIFQIRCNAFVRGEMVSFSLFNCTGELVFYDQQTWNDESILKLKPIASGLYFLTLGGKNYRVTSKISMN